MQRMYRSNSFRMPKELSRIMLPRVWSSPTPSGLADATAAWRWLKFMVETRASFEEEHPWWAKCVPAQSMLQIDANTTVIVVARTAWAVLVWPLTTVYRSDNADIFEFTLGERPIEWTFITKPDAAVVVPYKACDANVQTTSLCWKPLMLQTYEAHEK